MPQFHDKSDSLNQLIQDAKDSDNPQHGTPHSVQQSALQELRNRGYNDHDVTSIRLNGMWSQDDD